MDRLALLADPAVRSAFGGELGRDIEYHASIASTQDRARELPRAGGARSTIVVADQQTAGHGRGEKSWLSEPGASLLASWTFRPAPAEPALFALLAGVAVARALKTVGVADAGLKWPNDVWLTGGKIAGCLAHGASDHLVLGIGVNVSQRELPREI
ncbi:MAG TPA: biotin--[acetyl-CoA-carboxylase] ligase, partial [Candidatus Limnocylindria bacterium]